MIWACRAPVACSVELARGEHEAPCKATRNGERRSPPAARARNLERADTLAARAHRKPSHCDRYRFRCAGWTAVRNSSAAIDRAHRSSLHRRRRIRIAHPDRGNVGRWNEAACATRGSPAARASELIRAKRSLLGKDSCASRTGRSVLRRQTIVSRSVACRIAASRQARLCPPRKHDRREHAESGLRKGVAGGREILSLRWAYPQGELVTSVCCSIAFYQHQIFTCCTDLLHVDTNPSATPGSRTPRPS